MLRCIMSRLEKILYPKSIALIGASEKEGSVGNELLKNLKDFKGQVYPVNQKYETLGGLKCFKSVVDIVGEIDLAIVAVPAGAVLGVIDQCHQAQVHDVVIVSSGFKEVGGEGAVLEQEIKSKIEKYKMNVVGPNCLGVLNLDDKVNLNACFAPLPPQKGKIGFASQSGALITGIFNISHTLEVGFNQMVSLGNQVDISVNDVLECWADDKNVSQIALYMESINEPQKFRKVATKTSLKKPIIALKGGRSEAGARATASHTGSLAGSDNLANGLLSSCGVIREIELRDVFNSAQVLDKCVLPKNRRLGILTNAGGPGILATDSASSFGMDVPAFSEELKDKLKKLTLPQASVKNPVDLVASASLEHYVSVAEEMLKSSEIDMLLVIYLYITKKHDTELIQELEKLKKKYPTKPIISVFMTTPEFFEKVKKEMPDCSIPIFNYVDDAVKGFNVLLNRQSFLKGVTEKTPEFEIGAEKIEKIFAKAKKEARTLITTKESLDVMKNCGINTPKFASVLNVKDAIKQAQKIGYPVVLKMSSKKVSHKTDIGGVIVGIKNEKELEEKYLALENKLKENNLFDSLDGIIVMEQVSGGGREFIAGINSDANYGHQLMFGIGGIFVESLKEVAFRPCPLSLFDAQELINATKAKNLLKSVRGKPAANEQQVIESFLRLSKLVETFPNIKELDINPFMIDEKGNFVCVDSRIVF